MTDHLTDTQIKALERQLRERLTTLLAEIQEVLARSDNEQYRALAGEVPDMEDQSVADLLVDVTLAEIDRDVQEVREIEAALVRIGGANYGRCVDCNTDIEYERLKAYPTATRCRPCQEQHEKTYRDYRHDTL